MITYNPKHISRDAILTTGQRCADNDRRRWMLYCVYTGDGRTLISYDLWPEGGAELGCPVASYYNQRSPDFVFFPQGTDEDWAMVENERAERMAKI